MNRIRNRNQLIEMALTPVLHKARTLAIESLECAIEAADPKKLLYSKLILKNSTLIIDSYDFDLKQFKNIYVIGGGKAAGTMSEVIEDILGDRITAGQINVPYGNKYKSKIIKICEANHPIPNQAGIEGTKQIMAIAEQATQQDLVICLISGGGSSLMPLPREGITLEDKKAITEALLKSGASINEINTVRKHISAYKGGWLAKTVYPAMLINLILSDVIGDPLDVIASGPTVPDKTTFMDAKNILQKYNLWTNLASSIHNAILEGIEGNIQETPKPADPAFKKVYNIIIGNNKLSSIAALDYLKMKGLNTLLLSTTLEGEAKQAGKDLAAVAINITSQGKPLLRPAGIVAGGETTVTVTGRGIGGRNQELALSAALKLQGIENCVIASLSTDGVDGPTDAAGAIVDGFTISQSEKQKMNAKEYLENNDSYSFFKKLSSLIITGPTGTNVNDISVIVIL